MTEKNSVSVFGAALTRRNFVKAGGALFVGFGLVVGFGLLRPKAAGT